jgi:phage I-like protein
VEILCLQATGAAPSIPRGEPPARIVMLRWGCNETAQGPVIVGERTLAASQLWEGLGFGEVALDFNHNTVPGHPSYRGEPAPIAAMSGVKVVPGVGLVFEPVRWTPEGIKQRPNYRDYSPAVKVDESGEVILCHSAALARNGAVQGLHAFSAAGATMDDRPSREANQGTLNIDLLLDLLDLPDDATYDQVNAALEHLRGTTAGARHSDPESDKQGPDIDLARRMLGLPETATTEEISKAWQRKYPDSTAPNVALSTAVLGITAEEMEVMRTLGLPLATYLKHNARPVLTYAASPAERTPTQDEINRRLGITPEMWSRHNG